MYSGTKYASGPELLKPHTVLLKRSLIFVRQEMRFINVHCMARMASLLLLSAHLPLLAQVAAGDAEREAVEDELQSISLQDSKHVNDPVFDDEIPESLEPLPEPAPSNEMRLLT